MVYVPEKSIEPNVGLFLFNAGQKYRTGPHDIYVEIGLELASRGIFVITPDPGELGDGFKVSSSMIHKLTNLVFKGNDM
jgi:hypothetical protein